MREWLNASELAELKLPGLPATRQGFNELAEREGWLADKARCRLRKGRGGGLEYHMELLPSGALVAYAAQAIGAVAFETSSAVQAAADPRSAALTLPALEARDARLALIAAADRFARNATLSRRSADAVFSALYETGGLEIEGWIRGAVKSVSPRTLARWREAAKTSPARLGVDRGAARRGKGKLATAQDGEVRRYILALVAHQPHLTAHHIRELTADKFGFEPPPVRTFQGFLKALKAEERVLLARLTNPDAFKSRFRVSGTSSHPVARLNELWMIDASPADALCRDGRHSLYVGVDIYSRRLVVQVTRTPRAEGVALLLRRAILAWGVPERVKTDNGSDFVAKATQRLFANLEIETEQSKPFSPEEKGHIERAIGTLQRDLMPLLPGFIGHSVKDRKVIEERKAFSQRLGESDANAFCVDLSAADLQRYATEWAEGRYAHRPHEGLSGQTPFAVAAAWPGRLRRIEDVRALDFLLAPVAGKDGLRVVTKTGLRVDGVDYIFAAAMPGAQVFVRMDPQDLGRAFVFDASGERYLGEAIAPEYAGVDPAKVVAEAKAQQKRLLADSLAQARKDMRKIGKRDLVDAINRRAATEAGKLIAFPRPSDAHETPALRAAAEAFAAPPALAPVAPLPVEPTPITRLPETRQQRFRRARELEVDLAHGISLTDEDRRWLAGYRQGAEYLTMKGLYEDFGEAALK